MKPKQTKLENIVLTDEIKQGIRENTICINCLEPNICELVKFWSPAIPRDYGYDAYVWKCLHCGFERTTYVSYNPPGHWTGD
jgi:hypothetical protein